MNKSFFTILFSLFSFGQIFSQIEVKTERTFTGNALYGFMNGGSDLYYEYGFKELVSRVVAYNGEEFTVDIYTMETPLDAFGIYSIHAFKCLRTDSLGRFDCQSKYQLQVVDGSSYISIVFQSGSNAARKAADELYRIYVVDGKKGINIPPQLNYIARPYSGTVKYAKGKLGIDNVQSALSDLLEGITSYGVWYVTNADQKGNLVLFNLQSEKDCSTLLKRINKEKVIRKGAKFLLMKE